MEKYVDLEWMIDGYFDRNSKVACYTKNLICLKMWGIDKEDNSEQLL